jgi:hypothetical protein
MILKFLSFIAFLVAAFSVFSQNQTVNYSSGFSVSNSSSVADNVKELVPNQEQSVINALPASDGVQAPKRFRFGIEGGYGRILASSKAAEKTIVEKGITNATGAKQYYSKYKNGYLIRSSLHYMLKNVNNQSYWLGISHAYLNNMSRLEGTFDVGDGVNTIVADLSENVHTNFYALSYIEDYLLRKNNKIGLFSKLDLGLVTYRNQAFVATPMLLTSWAPALSVGFGSHYNLTDFLQLNCQLSVFRAVLRSMNYDNGYTVYEVTLEKEQYESLSRFELAIGLAFNF